MGSLTCFVIFPFAYPRIGVSSGRLAAKKMPRISGTLQVLTECRVRGHVSLEKLNPRRDSLRQAEYSFLGLHQIVWVSPTG